MPRDTAPRLVLASASPRRRELLARLRVPFDVLRPGVAEQAGGERSPELAARRLAREKAETARLALPLAPVLAADTIVVLDGEMLGKPADALEARAMLRRLRGRRHQVITAVAVMEAGHTAALFRHPVTGVQMREYGDDEIHASIARGDPFDKAGGYAIQDALFAPVERYDGCYCNVVGLPLWSATELLKRAGLDMAHVREEDLLPQCAGCPLKPV